MQDDGVIDLDFEEVGVNIDGAEVGMFSGSASIDREGAVVGLTLDAYVTDKAAPFGPPKKVFRYLKVPLRTKVEAFCTFAELLARQIANAIESGFAPEISDKLNDWCVSLAEQEFEHEPHFPGSIATFVDSEAAE
jgi:hypothetical protein